jgi:hypothetical protein
VGARTEITVRVALLRDLKGILAKLPGVPPQIQGSPTSKACAMPPACPPPALADAKPTCTECSRTSLPEETSGIIWASVNVLVVGTFPLTVATLETTVLKTVPPRRGPRRRFDLEADLLGMLTTSDTR